MNNYSQSKLIFSYSILCLGLLANRVSAADPNYDSSRTATETKKPESVLLDRYLSVARNQMGKFSKFIPDNKHDENKKNTVAAEPINLSANNNFITAVRNYIYNPEHPGELLGKLIYGYGFYLSMENQCILWGQNLLGKDNQIVANVKQNHKNNTAYLEVLKEQKVMIEKQQNTPKLQSLLQQIK